MIFGKGSKFQSIARFRCPRCQKGVFFVAHPYNLNKVGDLHTNCSECGLKYEREIGFYFGAMYVSYGLGVGLFVTCWFSFNFLFSWVNTAAQIAWISFLSLALSPYLYALSKIIWANLFFHYDKDAIETFRRDEAEKRNSPAEMK